MSFFINDTIANQVERGEWFYNFSDQTTDSDSIDGTTNANTYSIINTSKKTMMMLQVSSPEPIQVALWTTSTLTPSASAVTLRNMNFAESATPTGVTPSVKKAGQILYPNSTNNGTVGNSLDTPFILNTTDEYYLTIANISPIQQIITVSFFFREIT